MSPEEALQELHDSVVDMSRVARSHPDCVPAAAAQERVIQALSTARKALETPVLRFSGPGTAPSRSYPNDAGFDLFVNEECDIHAGCFRDVHLGIALEFPPGWWGRIVGRSSTFRKLGLLVIEGIIDEGFRGELFVGVRNLNHDGAVRLSPGDRICQLILHRTPPVMEFEGVAELAPSERGTNGFGSTGR